MTSNRKNAYGKVLSDEEEISDQLVFDVRRRSSSSSAKTILNKKIKRDDVSFVTVCWTLLATISPFFTSSNRRKNKAWLMLGAVLVILLADNGVLVYFSYVQRDYMTALQMKEQDKFYAGMMKFLMIIIAILPVVAAHQYIRGWFELEWRSFMTKQLLVSYFSGNTFYHLKSDKKLDNVDQRIGQDVGKFTQDTVWLLVSIVESVLGLFAFFGVLFSISPMFSFALIAYSAVGTTISIWGFGAKLMGLTKTTLTQEADFRFSLVRVREHAESIAFYQAGYVEESRAETCFTSLLLTKFQLLAINVRLKLFTRSFTWITYMLPPLVAAGSYFRGEIEFGTISQINMAFSHILHSLSLVISNLDALSTLSAEALRVQLLLLAVDLPRPEPEIKLQTSENIVIRAESLSIRNPDGHFLSQNVSFECHHHLLVVGPTGCGKSSLLRVLAGLWNSGSGTAHRHVDSFFVPQEPYIPHNSTLLEAISYPAKTLVSERDARDVLDSVNLEGIGSLQSKRDWSTLSLGEQQRIGFARVLLTRPPMIFFDEATSAVDISTESMLYSKVSDVKCYVSIGHRPSLLDFHTHVLILENGRAIYMDVSDYRKRLTEENLDTHHKRSSSEKSRKDV